MSNIFAKFSTNCNYCKNVLPQYIQKSVARCVPITNRGKKCKNNFVSEAAFPHTIEEKIPPPGRRPAMQEKILYPQKVIQT